jgi:hypothetical protein
MKQLIPQKTYYEEVSKIKTVDKTSITIFKNDLSVKRFSEYTTEDQEMIIDELMKWRIYFGILEEPSDVEYVINSQFIVENYPLLNITDLELAKKLSLTGELKIKQSITDIAFLKFSPLYIGKILNEYVIYKREAVHKVKSELQKIENQKEIIATPEEKLLTFRQYLVHAFTKKLHAEEFDDFGDSLFYFIQNNNLIDFNEKLIQDSILYGKEHAQRSQFGKSIKAVIGSSNKIEKINFPEVRKKFSRQYICNIWLDQMIEKKNIKLSSKEELKVLYEKINTFLDSITFEMIDSKK